MIAIKWVDQKLKHYEDDADVEVEISMRVPGLSFCLGRTPHCGSTVATPVYQPNQK